MSDADDLETGPLEGDLRGTVVFVGPAGVLVTAGGLWWPLAATGVV